MPQINSDVNIKVLTQNLNNVLFCILSQPVHKLDLAICASTEGGIIIFQKRIEIWKELSTKPVFKQKFIGLQQL